MILLIGKAKTQCESQTVQLLTLLKRRTQVLILVK